VQRAVRAGERAGAGRVHEVLRPLLRGVQLRAHGAGARRQRVPLLPRHAHRRPQEEAQVPLREREAHSTEDQETERAYVYVPAGPGYLLCHPYPTTYLCTYFCMYIASARVIYLSIYIYNLCYHLPLYQVA
jgi:hypothetical protein